MKFQFFALFLVCSFAFSQTEPETLLPDPRLVNGNSVDPIPPNQFCSDSGQALGDGSQNGDGFCSSVEQGSIPSLETMVSTLIVAPEYNETIDARKDFTVIIGIHNLETGFFDNPKTQYYLFPQTLNANGQIQGHQHITIQKLNGKGPMDPKKFAFFKGLNKASDDGQTLAVTVPAGTIKESGEHRICSISGSFSHQPVIMPVAQRGAQDDCIRVHIENAQNKN
ncbi:hypothetical protein HK098_000696 [Nowakowskiella sp. JEL0407]|nr:hypothetical protein HK098_000696 [Nowakowskiella sp. JEL0407]